MHIFPECSSWSAGKYPADCHLRKQMESCHGLILNLVQSHDIYHDFYFFRRLVMFMNSFWALVPPIVAIGLALIIKEAYSSLFIGGVLGALFLTDFHPIAALDTLINDGMVPAVADNAGIFIFLVILGIIVAIINISGGSAAFGKWAAVHIKTKVGATLATFFLGVLIFIDDYFNCLTVGAVMKPVTDSHKISRQKLAYLIDATAAPICMIAPVSSWAAAVSSTAEGLGTGMSGIELFIRSIPFNFYSLFTLVFVVAIGIMNFDYGNMAKYQKAAENGDLGGLADAEEVKISQRGKLIDLIIPVVFLVVVCTVGMMYVGGFFDPESANCGSLIGSFGDTDAFVALPWGGIIALVFTVIFAMIRKTCSFRESMDCVKNGFFNMVPPILILTLAVTLKNMTTLLGAREFIGGVMEGAAASLYSLLPAVIFVVGCLLAFATGTSWGTFGILIPIVTAMFPADSTLLFIGISACLAGAVCGDHCSPISDTTIMSSAGAQCEHVTHVSTQIPYAATVAVISFVMYIFAGFVQNAVICLLVGAVLTVAVLYVIKKKTAKA